MCEDCVLSRFPNGGRFAAHSIEPALERDFVTLSSFADAGAVLTAQPVTIHFEHEGRQRRYTPDFRVVWSDGRTDIVEVKYRADLRAGWRRLRPAFAAALEAAKRLLPLRNAPVDVVLVELAIT